MRIFTHGETPPQTLDQPEQKPISFGILPSFSNDRVMPAKILAQKDMFPLVEDFELIILDARQNPPNQDIGCDIFVQFVNRTTNQSIAYWEMYYPDTRPMDMQHVPNPTQSELIHEIEMGYCILITADDAFVYIVFAHDEDAKEFTHYCKVPKKRYESEWQAFIDWYHAHPEKRHPYPTHQERHAQAELRRNGLTKKQGRWWSRLFK